MARIKAQNIATVLNDKDYLAEKYGPVIENIQTNTIYARFKNQDLSGDPTSGTVEAKRFTNSKMQPYGTARAAGKGVAVKVKPVTVAVDQHDEIVEEFESADVKMYGVDGFTDRKVANHTMVLDTTLERAFFDEAATGGTEKNYTYTKKISEAVMAAVNEMEELENDFVDGVPVEVMGIVVRPSIYEQIHDEIDTLMNANINSAVKEFNAFHGVEIYKTHRLPEGVDYILMVKGSIAQPTLVDIQPIEKIQFSKAYGFGLYADYGTKTVAPDLVFYGTLTEADPT